VIAFTKRTHAQVDYGPGQPPHGEYCEICVHYIAGKRPACELVVNVDWDGWCRLWKQASARAARANRAVREERK